MRSDMIGLVSKLILLAFGAGAYALWGWFGWAVFALGYVVGVALATEFFRRWETRNA